MENMQGYNIKVVANRTGLSQHVIRVWERRYSAVTPQRTETNRRVYTESDIEKLKLLQMATSAGHHIGRIAQLSIDELKKIVAQDTQAGVSGIPSGAVSKTGQGIAAKSSRSEFSNFKAQSPQSLLKKQGFESLDAVAHLEACLQSIESFDTFALEKALMQASVALSLPNLIDKVVVPLMEKVGEFWQDGTFRVAHEHAVSGVVRTFLGSLRFSKPATEYAPIAIIATPAGQLHEIGALMAAVTAASEGWQVVYLGPNLPVQEIALAATKKDAKAILLSIVYPQDDPFLGDELARLRTMLKNGVAVIVGGRAARSYTDVLQNSQAIILEDLLSLRRQLERVRG